MDKKYDEVSSGFIIYRKNANRIEYLILESSKNKANWTPPKGHLEKNETEFEAAIRETMEEAGLIIDKDYEVNERDFTIISSYPTRKGMKKVVYFLAPVKDNNIKITLSNETSDFKWMSLDELNNFIQFDKLKLVFQEAENFLRKL